MSLSSPLKPMKHACNNLTRRQFIGSAAAGVIGAGLAGGLRAEPQGSEVPEFSFGVLADVQYADAPAAMGRYYRNSIEKLTACVEDFNRGKLEFVVQLGDLIDRDFSSFDRVLAAYNKLSVPKYHVLGNHDFSVAEQEKNKVRKRLGTGRGYYDFDRPGWRFVVLDGNDVSLQANAPGSERHEAARAMMQQVRHSGGPNGQPYNGALGAEQIAWLQDRLDAADKAGEKVLLFSHFPIVPKNLLNLWNDDRLVEILQSHKCVVAYLSGHNHAGNYAEKNGIHYLTVEGMVDTPERNAYAVVEIYADRLRIVGRGRVPNRVLRLR